MKSQEFAPKKPKTVCRRHYKFWNLHNDEAQNLKNIQGKLDESFQDSHPKVQHYNLKISHLETQATLNRKYNILCHIHF